ncbi:helix-turn-helix domain-containing protein, partial [Blautia pseudococcoides]|nr:helix-turn-helix domain-containing protein [Blautia pseudococcoides]
LYFIDGTDAVPNFNYGQIVDRVNRLVPVLADKNAEGREEIVMELKKILYAISNKDFLLQLSDNIIISLGTQLPSHTLPEITDFLYQLHKEEDTGRIAESVLDYMNKLSEVQSFNTKQYSPFISRLIDYIYEHYSNPDLTLKWISENYLYMNVNYVSRCFTKETGEKFSGFLMKLRVQKAKEILAARDTEQIQNVAQLVGCGNTPYYFSKIFKKCTGLTPSAYVKKMGK